MNKRFFENPILNSPYEYPSRHWELDGDGQPTQRIIGRRRRAEFISPIPKPKKRGGRAGQGSLVFDEGMGLSTREQRYERHAEIINSVRHEVDDWRRRPDPGQWRVTRRPRACSGTGGTTGSAISGPSSVKSKRSRPSSG